MKILNLSTLVFNGDTMCVDLTYKERNITGETRFSEEFDEKIVLDHDEVRDQLVMEFIEEMWEFEHRVHHLTISVDKSGERK